MSVKDKLSIGLQKIDTVVGHCYHCEEETILVAIVTEFYRCTNCGADTKQHVNGKITYLPVMTSPTDGATPFVKEWKDG